MAAANTLGSDPDGDDELRKRSRLEARAARFNKELPGNRYKELEEQRKRERKVFEEQGSIGSGQTTLGEAVDLRGSCEDMCCEYEREFRDFTREVNPFEKLPNGRMDHLKAVAAYTRSDAGAGAGDKKILPSDMRTPGALVRSLDYLVSAIMPQQPSPNPNAVNPPAPTERRALGYSAGFIRDRTRAIRKEFAMQSSWGHDEAIATFERIARWHILCLRELQEETGSNTDMHIDSAELGRCFVSLRQHYNDRREELGIDTPCPNEPEFRAYMLIYDLTSKSVAIPTSELPTAILDHPMVQLAWQLRQAAQRNFDSQKEGSKLNAELGANLITRFVRLLKQDSVPYLLSCLVEVRLREMRRSAIRALTRTYPRLKTEAVRYGDDGMVAERKMILFSALDRILGAEHQEDEGPAFDDIDPISKSPEDESASIMERFGIPVHYENGEPVGAMINLGAPYNDNKDAPHTRRWKLISDKKGANSYGDVVNGKAGVAVGGAGASQPVTFAPPPVVRPTMRPSPLSGKPLTASAPAFKPTAPIGAFSSGAPKPAFPAKSAFPSASAFPSTVAPTSAGAFSSASAFASNGAFEPSVKSAFQPAQPTPTSSSTLPSTGSAFATPKAEKIIEPAPSTTPAVPPPAVPSFFSKPATAAPSATPSAPPPPKFEFAVPPPKAAPAPPLPKASFFPAASSSETGPSAAGPSKPSSSIPSFFSTPSQTLPRPPTATKLPSPPKKASPPKPPPEPPRIKMARETLWTLPGDLRHRLVREVVDQLVEDASPSLRKVCELEVATRAASARVTQRHRLLAEAAPELFDLLLDEVIEEHCKVVYLRRRRAERLAGRIARAWRAWTSRQKEQRAAAARERELRYNYLRDMPLARSQITFGTDASSSRSQRSESVWSTRTTTQEQVDEKEVERSLRHTEHARKRLFQPSTFLLAISEHVAPLLKPRSTKLHFDDEPVWETVFLSAEHAGTPAAPDARQWLVSKFTTTNGDDLYHDGVDFATTVSDVHGDLPGSADAGLYVLEAPLNTIKSKERELNRDDASDRLEAAAGAAQQRSKYHTGLLILTWEDETLSEVTGRLGIEDDIEQFDNVATLSLQGADDIDERFQDALFELVPGDPRKGQVVVPMEEVVARVEARWDNLAHFVSYVLKQMPKDAALSAQAVATCVETLSRLPGLIDAVIDDLPVSADSSYDPPIIPALPALSNLDLPALASTLADYLSESTLGLVDGVALTLPPLRQAGLQGQPLPLLSVISALAANMFSTIGRQRLRLDVWLTSTEPIEAADRILTRISAEFDTVIEASTSKIAQTFREARAAELARAAAVPLPVSPKTPKKLPESKGTKRRADSSSPAESKSAKTARLLRVLAEANKSMSNRVSA